MDLTPDLSALLSEDEPTAMQAQAALVQALRRKQQLGMLGTLSGGRLAPIGSALNQGVENDQKLVESANAQRAQRAQYKATAAASAAKDQQDHLEKLREFAYRQQHDAASLAQADQNAEATRKLAEASLANSTQHTVIAQDEHDQKVKTKAEHDAALDIDFDGGKLVGGLGQSEGTIADAKKVAGAYNGALQGMSALERSLDTWLADPLSPKNFVAVSSGLNSVASQLNAANGGGAMANDEYKRIKEALGVDLVSPAGLAAMAQSLSGSPDAGRLLKARLQAARQTAREIAVAKLSAQGGYRFEPATKATKGAGSIKMQFPDGSTHDVSSADITEAKRRGGKEVK